MPSFLLNVGMGAAAAVADSWIDIGGIIELVLMILPGASYYFLMNALLGISAFNEAVAFVMGRV